LFGKAYMRISENKPPIKENGEIRPCINPNQKPGRSARAPGVG
jgi:hypothetical protein